MAGKAGRVVVGLAIITLIVIAYILVSGTGYTLVWASTQMSRPSEERFVEGTLIYGFWRDSGVMVEFEVVGYDDLYSLLSNGSRVDLVSDLHLHLVEYYNDGLLRGAPVLEDRSFYPVLEDLSKSGDSTIYTPWLTATYMFVVNVKAFDYLPKGLTVEDVVGGSPRWTYEALLEWARNLYEETGRPLLGFPAGDEGLFYRFIHGYLLPSYTGYQIRGLDDPQAVDAFLLLRELWNYTSPSSLEWDSMEEPLIKGEVWIAWDHTARLERALATLGGDLVPVPPPRGPAGRGYLVVIVGLSIPQSSSDPEHAADLIEYLTRPEVQAKTSEATGFLPAVVEAEDLIGEAWLSRLVRAVSTMYSSQDQVACMIPFIPGGEDEFRDVYIGLFQEIVVMGGEPGPLLVEAKKRLEGLFVEAGVSLPPPDG